MLGKICNANKKSPPRSRVGLTAMKLMVAQVFNLCAGGVILFPYGTGFQPVNPLRIIGSQAGTPAPLMAYRASSGWDRVWPLRYGHRPYS